MALEPVAMVVSAVSLRYVMTILLDLIQAYDLKKNKTESRLMLDIFATRKVLQATRNL